MVMYLTRLMEEEYNNRIDNRIKRLITQSKFPSIKHLSEFQFSQSEIKKQQILEIAECHFIGEKHNVCFMGQTGTGKTHLAISIGIEACKKRVSTLFFSSANLVNLFIEARKNHSLLSLQKRLSRAQLIIIDELGYIPFSQEGAEHLFQFFSDRYERGSLLVTTNIEFANWTQFMINSTMTSALLDRFTHHCDVVMFSGESYRFRHRKSQQKKA